ncbi:MAG: hypothetical protein HYW91_00975 [Candidatus Sungbacteria bacterium]|nr:hypothetical protein [Candidatus Sungbacteria bacterium]
MKRFHKGQPVLRRIVGVCGTIASEETKVSRADRRRVWIKNRRGEKSVGPFSQRTGKDLREDLMPGIRQSISPLPPK